MTFEQQVLERWLAGQARALTARDIAKAWSPTWSLNEVEVMLRALARVGTVRTEGTTVVRFVAQQRPRRDAGAQGASCQNLGELHG